MKDIFIWEKKKVLSDNFCDVAIHRFEKDPDKIQGRVGMNTKGTEVNLDIKRSVDLHIGEKPEWYDIEEIFRESLLKNLDEYFDYLNDNKFILGFGKDQKMSDSGYQIQKTKPGEFYDWHNDFATVGNNIRTLTYIWYLNDIDEGGETEFFSGKKIKPEKGKIVFFPATWTYLHRGNSPINKTKYICTGWIYLEY
jgi:hypothetical protein